MDKKKQEAIEDEDRCNGCGHSEHACRCMPGIDDETYALCWVILLSNF